MSSLVRHPEIGLSIVDESPISPLFADDLPDDQRTFVRRINFNDTFFTLGSELTDVLGIVDEVLTDVAGACGAMVVEHEWLLTRRPHEGQTPNSLIPKGYHLAARVAIIDRVIPDFETRDQLETDLRRYRNGPRSLRYTWTDKASRQFTHGTIRGNDHSEPQVWLHDIEPRITKKKKWRNK